MSRLAFRLFRDKQRQLLPGDSAVSSGSYNY